jgi:hypothetical protein
VEEGRPEGEILCIKDDIGLREHHKLNMFMDEAVFCGIKMMYNYEALAVSFKG